MSSQTSSFVNEVRRAYFNLVTPDCLPALLWGAPGTAKTSIVEEIAAHLQQHLETLIASTCDPTDFGGILWPDGNCAKRLPMEWVTRLLAAGKGIAFFDEISTCPTATQHSLLRVLLSKVVGDVAVPGATFIAAANPPEQAGGSDLTDPMQNRFIHHKWNGPSVEEWGAFLMTGESVVARLPKFDRAAWDKQYPQSKALAAAFLRKRPSLFNENPDDIRGRFPMAYCTPRSWAAAARLHATCAIFNDESAALYLVAGAIGEGAAAEFMAFIREADLPDADELLADPSKWVPDPKRPDRTFAVVLMIANAASQPQAKPEQYQQRWEAAWEVMHLTMAHGKDLVVVGARMLAKARPAGKAALMKPRVQDIIRELVAVVRDSGLMGGE